MLPPPRHRVGTGVRPSQISGALNPRHPGHGAESALSADLHARLNDSSGIPTGYRDKLRHAVDRAIKFATAVAATADNEGDARRATP